ncbi:glycoside hydrolase [Flavobacterium akiainvivens]|uniref:Glycoside hydrolase n=1 Tax=Flavobacterium akiainvivens TaxID=1202724 RepID=A0A0M8MLS2_9FLAO|nr:glycoside hydrolase family 88 protein [Flavobacterium akiainvivens]KOS08138.1 glycoside hydrolase [Flavobacterium akiainvivens]SFQ72242.1 Glycosyl Hydrolase Family 88 [Flavobacterium akiainvivens]
MNRILTSVLVLTLVGCSGQNGLTKKADAALKTAVNQYTYLSAQVEPGQYPKTFEHNKLETSDSGWWCSGFYPGTLLYLDEAQNAPELKKEALEFLKDLEKEQFNTTTHDLGFMMYCSFGNAERLSPDTEYEAILMKSAQSLSSRYNPVAKVIKSWDPAPWNGADPNEMPVIIDNMMNLELLFWAARHSGDSRYYQMAVNHADTTLKYHFRSDYSSFHVVVYDTATGQVTRQITNQGAADGSSWARGQSWGLYGYTVMYRETKDKKYLVQAQNIADYILANLPKDKVPYWDYQAPGIPHALRDSSAAAVTASALLELQQYVDKETAARYTLEANAMLETLLKPDYLADNKQNGCFILKHGVGNMPKNSEVDVPLTYGDYYFVEALMRYKKLKG